MLFYRQRVKKQSHLWSLSDILYELIADNYTEKKDFGRK